MRAIALSSTLKPNLVMKTAVVNRNFAIQNPANHKRIEFVKGEVVKGAKLRMIQKRHYEQAFVTGIDEKNDSSIARRLTGRTQLHRSLGTDPTLDLEWQVHQVVLSIFGNEALRAKGSGQVGFIETGIKLVKEQFANDVTIERFSGTDDILAHRPDGDGRDVVWAHDRLTVNKAIAALVAHYEAN